MCPYTRSGRARDWDLVLYEAVRGANNQVVVRLGELDGEEGDRGQIGVHDAAV
jgi:hypothetical protein